MSLLIPPLILLGLVGILILIIIYIIKPNYQQKAVSSTFIWRLSLKYKRKKLPVNKLRNILLFVCQLLTLTVMGLIIILCGLFRCMRRSGARGTDMRRNLISPQSLRSIPMCL